MTTRSLKLATVAAFRQPQMLLQALPAELSPHAKRNYLSWFHESGLALYLSEHLAAEDVPEWLCLELRRCREANVERTKKLLEQFERVTRAMQDAGIRYAVLKGFSLNPDFCASPYSRHQTDIDLLIRPVDVDRAVPLLVKLGYRVESSEESGEVKLVTPSLTTPTRDDDLYALPKQFQVELHNSIFESANGVSLALSERWEDLVIQRQVEGISYPSLDVSHRFVIQCLHAFRHVLHGWLRLGWLYELSYMIENHSEDEELWDQVNSVVEKSSETRNGCALALELARLLFGTRLPPKLREWCDRLPRVIRLWCSEYGVEWALADFPGNRLSLLVHREFVADPEEWRRFQYARSGRTLAAITAEKLFDAPFLYSEISERLAYFGHYIKWRRLRAQLG
jgi:hypothetical protein